MDEPSTHSLKSFKFNRKSGVASQLKSLISHQLLLFYPQLSDDILAEYITVLVCNGKNQNQARDDLEAFLGARTQEFVSWLWKFLLKNETQLIASVSSSQKDKTNVNGIFGNCQRQANSDCVNFMDERDNICCSPRQACTSDDMEPPKDHHPPPPKEMTNSLFQFSVPQRKVANVDSTTKVLSSSKKYQTESVDDYEKDEHDKICCSSRQACESDDMEPLKDHYHPRPPKEMKDGVPQRKVANFGSAAKVSSAVKKYQTESVDDFEETTTLALKDSASIQASTFLSNSPHCTKLSDKDPGSFSGSYPASLPESTPGSGMHFSNASKLSGNAFKRNLHLPSVTSLSHLKKPRKSVWDRLGKPQHDAPSRSQTAGFNVMDNAQCNKEWISQNPALFTEPSEQINPVSPLPTLPRAEGSNRFRQVNQIAQDRTQRIDDYPLIHVGTTDSEVSRMGKFKRKWQFGGIGSHTDAGMATEKRAGNQFEKACQSHNTLEQVNDVKLRLCQIEKEMVKLRTKQISVDKDGSTNLLTNTGVVKPTGDESRTVLVTNVHVKATKNTLSMFFQKCGAVVDVVILADCMPSTQQRSAYITFQNKEAAEKALRFSGASFYSRTIKVSRKGVSTTIGQTQIAGDVGASLNNVDPK